MNVKICWFAVCLAVFASRALAMNSVEIKLTRGENYQAYRAMGSADLDGAGSWNADVSFTRAQFTDPEAAGWNNLYFLELNYLPEDSLSFSGNVSYSLDSSQITAMGPGVSVFYTHFRTAADFPPEKPRPPMPVDVFTLGLDCPLLFYQADVETSADPATVRKINLTQASPMLFLDFALMPGRLNANVSGSCSFYSENPAQIAMLAGPSLSTSAAAALESLMAGLQWSNWYAGMFATLPYGLQLGGNYGRQKQVYPEEWVDSYDLNLSGKLLRFLKAKIAWRHFASSAGGSDLYSVALRFYY